ncbi:MAG TPA: branched-chain amino acid ABC transporter permease [Mycobacteriales bacterium]|jgi:branched-chain amino acid transport system permease protein|nr:branched-chain amino acid ABC transporter permease [Mycobacteriales bacterium]
MRAERRWAHGGVALRAVFWLLLLGVLLLPALDIDFAYTTTTAVVFAIVALSLNILIGYTGQLSLGQQGFVGVGSLVAANFVTRADWPFAVGLAVATVAGVLVALVLGAVALRITGLYLSLITLVFGVVVASSLFQVSSLTNGGAGLDARRPDVIGSNQRYYLFALAVLLVVVYIDRQLTRTKLGRALAALKENERAAEAFGVDVTRYKLLAFGLCGAIAGLAGGVYVFQLQQFSSQNFQGLTGINLALLFVVMVIVGGAGNRAGVLVAAAFFGVLDTLLNFVFGHLESVLSHVPLLSGYYQADSKAAVAGMLSALLLLQTLIFNPGGIGQVISPVTRWLSGRPFSLHDPDAETGVRAVEGSSVRA